jgi:hypothetical protein
VVGFPKTEGHAIADWHVNAEAGGAVWVDLRRVITVPYARHLARHEAATDSKAFKATAECSR